MEDVFEAADDPGWVIHEDGYDPLRERGIESRFAIGNGFLGIRGVPGLCGQHVCVSWPQTYVAGLFDTPDALPRVPALVSAPDWVGVAILVDGEPLLQQPSDMARYSRTLDMKRGVLLTTWHSPNAVGKVIRVRSLRLVSLADRDTGLQLVWIESAGPAELTLQAACVMSRSTLVPERLGQNLGVWRTKQSKMSLAVATSKTLQLDGQELAPSALGELAWRWRWNSMTGQTAFFQRVVSFARGDDIHDAPGVVAQRTLGNTQQLGWRTTIERHEAAWKERWHCADVMVEGDAAAQQALRFAVYHLNSAANPTDDLVSIGARALTGDDYRGHVFWDTEIFLLPFYTLTWPEAARALLMYRYHTLAGARAKATRMGLRGAFYAWESTRSGEETTPEQVTDATGMLIQITSGKQEEHISADVAYAVWQYWQSTLDDRFLLDAGAEIILETARFWASHAQPEADGRRHIRGVEGPDEYHEDIDDNAFTNVMARWNVRRGIDVARLLRERWPERWAEIAGRLELDDAELEQWEKVADTLAIGCDAKTGLFEQFTGFFKLDAIDLPQYAARTTPMDVVLGRERTQHSQVIKQADVVALLALLPEEFDHAAKIANFRFYEPLCDHGSSLSRAMHAMVAARLGDTELAMHYFHEAASIDLADTPERSAGGVHIATLGGLWQAAVFGFGGLSWLGDDIAFDPHLPASWTSLGFRFQWRGRRVKVRIEQAGKLLSVTLEDGEPVKVIVAGEAHELLPGPALRIVSKKPANH
jgi:trehalose/maltose hydrolase-like predicted phosphorylase